MSFFESPSTALGVFLLAVAALSCWRFVAHTGGTLAFLCFVVALVVGVALLTVGREPDR